MGIPIPMLDLMFFLTENRDNPRHVGATLIFERPRRGGARVISEIIEAYRNAVPMAPFNRVPELFRLGLPQWREVDNLDMHWHVQHLQLAPPGTDAQLDALVAELHAPMLERDRPGWRAWIIEGLERDRFALLIKVHHALVDGESGIALMHHSLSHSPRDKKIRPVFATSLPARSERRPESLLSDLERRAGKAARTALAVGLGSDRVLDEALAGLRGFSGDEPRAFTAPLTPMNEPIHNARTIAHVVLPLSSMKAVARAWDTTLNDVALCVLDAAMNRYLRTIDRPPARPLVTICPVSLHEGDIQQATTNVSALWTPLGAPTATIGARMRQVMAQTRAAKARLRSLPKDAAYAYAVLTFALGEAVALVPRGSADYFVPANVLISNVRGSTTPLYLNGARLEALCPASTLLSGMGLNVTLMSYAGQVVIGFTANASALPGADRLAGFTQQEFARLERHTRRLTRPVAKTETARSRPRRAHPGNG
jgi:diacylglycerol O-acyltransferase / wax synthase